jgi:hypothetical protein
MSQRYGAPSRIRSSLVIFISGLVGVVALGWLGWVIWTQSTPDVESSLKSYTVLSAHESRATVELRLKSTDVHGSCLLRAYAEDHTVVGELNFAIPAGQGKRPDITRSIRTERRATAVSLVGCTTPNQSHPR